MTDAPPPWHAAFPAPLSTPSSLPRADLLSWLQGGQTPGKDFILIDLRRNDHTGGTILGSLNLPAQSLYPSIPTLYALLSAAGIKTVIWYCGSSQGRGTRAAAWFLDYIVEQGAGEKMRSVTLLGGIKGWARAGEEYTALMEGYEAEAWKES